MRATCVQPSLDRELIMKMKGLRSTGCPFHNKVERTCAQRISGELFSTLQRERSFGKSRQQLLITVCGVYRALIPIPRRLSTTVEDHSLSLPFLWPCCFHLPPEYLNSRFYHSVLHDLLLPSTMAPTFVKVFLGFALALSATSAVSTESHTIKFDNQCVSSRETVVLHDV